MAPYTSIPLSPAELSYLHTSLAQDPPIRPDGRSPTQFRPLVAETDILPTANGSARICFADGTEAIVGVKAEVEKTQPTYTGAGQDESNDIISKGQNSKSQTSWLDLTIDIPHLRDDDPLPLFLASLLTETLSPPNLAINTRFHWHLYIDILLLSPPLSYPLPLLSLTTHLALLSTRLPALVSEADEDPLFNDDWEASTTLYPKGEAMEKPPITLLIITVGGNIIFDPSGDELAIADAVLALTVSAKMEVLGVRTLDPPARLTGAGTLASKDGAAEVWSPPRGGMGRGVLGRIIGMVVKEGGVGEEVLAGLAGVEV